MKTVTASFTISYSIHDSWTELLSGTRTLLDFAEEQSDESVIEVNLLRLVLVSSHQMIEVMFFLQINEAVKDHPETVKKLLQYDLDRRISFRDAMEKWPVILTNQKFNFGSEPFQSMIRLSNLRNSAIHHTASVPKDSVGESAFYTAIESSKAIYNHFNSGQWGKSEYAKFVESNQAKSKLLLLKALQE